MKRSLARSLSKVWPQNGASRNVLIYLQGIGISAKIAQRILNEYGAHTQQIIQNNPYQLAQDVFLIGFRKADQIARRMGLLPDDPHRLRAGLHYALNELAREGHTYAPRDDLLEKAAELLGVDDLAALTIALQGQVMASKLVEDKLRDHARNEVIHAVYLLRYFRAETAAGQVLQRIARGNSPIIRDHRETDWAQYLSKLSERNDVSLSPQQLNAVRAALTSKVSVLTGGPGTGKTTTLQMLINALKERDSRFHLASPTGRAAKRLGEATGEGASTIHRLLGFSADEGGFEHDESNPLPTDLVVIDEASCLTCSFSTAAKGAATDDPPDAGRRCRSIAIGGRWQCPARCH